MNRVQWLAVFGLFLAPSVLAWPWGDKDWNYALRMASIEGSEQRVRDALEHGAQVNHQNDSGMTSLMHASLRGHQKVVHALLKAGADTRVTDDRYNTALHYASKGCNHRVLLELLRSKDAPVNSQNHVGQTPLIAASEQACPRALDVLLSDARVNVRVRDDWGHDAMDYAVENDIVGFDSEALDRLKSLEPPQALTLRH